MELHLGVFRDPCCSHAATTLLPYFSMSAHWVGLKMHAPPLIVQVEPADVAAGTGVLDRAAAGAAFAALSAALALALAADGGELVSGDGTTPPG